MLSNEERIKKELEYYFQEGYGTSYDKEDVVTSIDKNSVANSLIRKLEDKDYIFKKRSLDCVAVLKSEISLFEWDILCMKFRRRYNSERVGREVYFDCD